MFAESVVLMTPNRGRCSKPKGSRQRPKCEYGTQARGGPGAPRQSGALPAYFAVAWLGETLDRAAYRFGVSPRETAKIAQRVVAPLDSVSSHPSRFARSAIIATTSACDIDCPGPRAMRASISASSSGEKRFGSSGGRRFRTLQCLRGHEQVGSSSRHRALQK